MKKLIILIILISTSFLYAEGSAPKQTISILNFENITPQNGTDKNNYIGKALSELLLSDLIGINDLQFIERSEVNRVLGEIELGMTGLVDEENIPKIGKLVGANYLVLGNYYQEKNSLIITVKLVETATGKIAGAKSITSDKNNIYAAKNLISINLAEIFENTFRGIDLTAFKKRNSIKLDNDAINNLGKAIDLSDKGNLAEAEQLMRELLKNNPNWQELKTSIAALEKRLKAYDKKREDLLKQESGQPITWQSFTRTTVGYVTAARYTDLYNYCMKLRSNPPADMDGALVTTAEMIDYYIVFALQGLKKLPEAIREGEYFLKQYPTSMYYQSVKSYVTQSADTIVAYNKNMKEVENIRLELEKKYKTDNSNNLNYYIAQEYFRRQLYKEALPYWKKIDLKQLDNLGETPDNILYYMFQCYYNIPDKKNGDKILRTIEAFYPDSSYISGIKVQMSYFPE